jgi:LPS-assembly protein
VEFNQQNFTVTRGDLALHYQPALGKNLNLASRYTQEGLRIQDISAQWPLTGQLYGMGRWQYSSRDKKTLDSLLGLEYQASCWSVRVLAQRTVSTEQRYVNKIQLQLELNDLGRVGSNALDVLKNTIFGYQSPATMQVNQP